MARPRVATDLEDLLSTLNDRIRALELERNKIQNWSLIEDGITGQLLAVRDNGQGVPRTITVLAP